MGTQSLHVNLEGEVVKYSSGRIALGCVAALLIGLLSPFLMGFAPLLVLMTVAIGVLYAWAGFWPVGIGVGAAALSLTYIDAGAGSWLPLMLGAPATLLPGLYVVLLIRRRLPFFQALVRSIAAQVLGLVFALVLARSMLGMDLVDALLSWFHSFVRALPVVRTQTWLLSLGRLGFFGSATGVNFALPFMTPEQQETLLQTVIDMLDRSLRVNLTSMLISSGVLSGLLAYVLCARICARRGDEPHIDYVHLHDWRLPKSAIIALPAALLLSVAAANLGLAGAEAMYVTLLDLCYLLFALQGASALSRRMRQSGTTRGRRNALVVLMLLFARWLLALLGLYSALMGSKGLISEYIRKRNAN